MKTNVHAKFLRIAIDLMTDVQLKSFQQDLEERMDYLKVKLMEHTDTQEMAVEIKEEYNTLKEIRNMFVADLTNIINKF